ncbi:hypothetical protein BFN03_05300 [Rhodococcus sp. WMMA185]|nr:hypothetical protein BFN03_05300 [Rhodococcus sp. WMMA185]
MAFAAAALLTTTGFAGADTARAPRIENDAAATAVRALTSPEHRTPQSVTAPPIPPHGIRPSSIPADFDTVMGYAPIRIGGMLVNPNGECSSPVPLPAEFDTPCMAHDLGYDLLRYASRSGAELGPWARKSLDAQLDERMHAACETRVAEQERIQCFVMANIATTAVAGNSWRQDYSTPIPESGASLALAGGSVAILVGAARILRRHPRTAEVVA